MAAESPTHFADRLALAVQRTAAPVTVGLDPRVEQLPAPLARECKPGDLGAAAAAACGQFCCEVIDVVAPLVPAVKPQCAFFEQLGPAGMAALAQVIEHAHAAGLLVVVDGKRNDIGSTAAAYAHGFLGPQASPWQGDALTVSPYLGDDSLEPFVARASEHGAGIFVLVKTSNPGGAVFQDLVAGGHPLYRHVGDVVERFAAQSAGRCGYGSVGAVVGATYPEQLAELRAAMPHTWFLVPGFGAQGGSAADVAGAFDSKGLGAVVNNARGIIFAHQSPAYRDRFAETQWQQAVEAATRDMIEHLRADTPAGNLLET